MMKRIALPGIFAATVAAAILALPDEQSMGGWIRLVYLHAAAAQAAIVCFILAAAASFADVVRRGTPSWAHPLFAAALRLWGFQLALGVVSMKVVWGGYFWTEPKVRAGLVLFLAALLVEIAHLATRSAPVRTAGLFACGLLAIQTQLFSPDLFHPRNAVFSSRNHEFVALFLVISLAFLGLALLYAALRRATPPPGGEDLSRRSS